MSYFEDFRRVLEYIHKQYPDSPKYAIGHSFGSNTLTRYLGMCGSNNRDCLLQAAVSIGNPFDFQLGIKYLEDGLSDSYIRKHRQRILKL
jgi:predicted alpha/beta-fold hydrolase